MEINNIFNEAIMAQTGITIIKGSVLFISLVYFIYAVTFSRRVKIMNKNLKTGYEKSFTKISRFHIFLSFLSVVFFLLSIVY